MTDAPGSHAPDQPPAGDERRVRAGLRALVDEMMEQLRNAAGTDAWTEEERRRAEADLERIMAHVRAETFRGPDGG